MQHFEVPTEQIIAWRHHFHENPELSFKEFKTSQFIPSSHEIFVLTILLWFLRPFSNPVRFVTSFRTQQKFTLIAEQKMIKTVNTLSNALPKLPKTLLRLTVQLLK